MAARLSCLIEGTVERQQIKDLLHEYAAQSIGGEGKEFSFSKAYTKLREEAKIEIDIESAAVLYMEEFDTTDSWFSTEEEVEERAGLVFNDILSKVAKAQPFTETITIGERSPGSAAADIIMKLFADMSSPNLGVQSTMKLFQEKMTKAAKVFADKDINIDAKIEAIKQQIEEAENTIIDNNNDVEFTDLQNRKTNLYIMKTNAEIDKGRIEREKNIAKEQGLLDVLMNKYKSNNDIDIKNQIDEKRDDIRELIKEKKEFLDINKKQKETLHFKEVLRQAFLMNKRGYMNTSLSVLNSAKDVVDEFKREMNEYVKQAVAIEGKDVEWAGQIETWTNNIINQTYDLLLSNKEISFIVKDALTKKGFTKEINKDGKKIKVYDWTKLTDAANDVEYLKAQVISALKDTKINGIVQFTDNEIDIISNALEREYDALKTDIVEKRLSELAKKNNVKLSPEQISKAKRLVKLYNMGWFEADPTKYDKILNDIIGLSDIDAKTFNELERLGRALNELYRATNESEQFIKSAVNNIGDQIATLTDKYRTSKSKSFKYFKWFDAYMSYAMRTRLYTVSNAFIANNVSGVTAMYRNYIYNKYFKDINNTKGGDGSYYDASKKFDAYMADIIRQDITNKGGLQYGDLSSTFVVRGSWDNYLNNLIKEKAGEGKVADNVHKTLSLLNGRLLLDGQDSYFKYRITSTIFIKNMISVVSSVRETEFVHKIESNYSSELKSGIQSVREDAQKKVKDEINKGKKERLAQHREDAIIEINQKLYGTVTKDGKEVNVWEEKLQEAKDIIGKANIAAGTKVVPDSDIDVARLAGDMLKMNLLEMKNIRKEHILAAYNSAYKTAGYELGHVPNNLISKSVQTTNAFLSRQLDDALKEDISNAWVWMGLQTLFNKIVNPFLGGGSNWVVNKYHGMGIGIIRSKFVPNKMVEDIKDIMTDEGLAELEESLWNENLKTSLFVQGASGIIANTTMTAIGVALFFQFFKSDDEEEKKLPLYTQMFNLIDKNKKYKKFFRELYTGYLSYFVGIHNANLIDERKGETPAQFINRFLDNSLNTILSIKDQTVSDILSLEYERYTYQSIYAKMISLRNKGEIEAAMGLEGEIAGKTFGHPIPALRFIEQVKDTWNRDADYSESMSFMHGFFKTGVFNTFGNRQVNVNPLVFWGGSPYYLVQPSYGLSSLPGAGPAAIKALKNIDIENMNDLRNYIIKNGGTNKIQQILSAIKAKDSAGRMMPIFDKKYTHIIEEIMHNNDKPVKLLEDIGFTKEQIKILSDNEIFTVSELFKKSAKIKNLKGINMSEDQRKEMFKHLEEYKAEVTK